MTQTSVGHDCLDPSYLPTFIKPAPIQKLQLGNKFQFQKWAHLHALQDSFANVQGIGKSKIKAKTQRANTACSFSWKLRETKYTSKEGTQMAESSTLVCLRHPCMNGTFYCWCFYPLVPNNTFEQQRVIKHRFHRIRCLCTVITKQCWDEIYFVYVFFVGLLSVTLRIVHLMILQCNGQCILRAPRQLLTVETNNFEKFYLWNLNVHKVRKTTCI